MSEAGDAVESLDLFMLVVITAVLLLAGWLVCYLLGGYGMRRLCRKLGIVRSGRLAYAPVFRFYTMGALLERLLSEKEKKAPFRLLLPGIGISSAVASCIHMTGVFGGRIGPEDSPAGILRALLARGPVFLGCQLLLVVAGALTVYLALHRQRSKHAALLAALCLPLPFLRWILLWAAGISTGAPPKQEESPAHLEQWLASWKQQSDEIEEKH